MPKRPDFKPFQRGEKWLVSIPPAMSATGKRVRKTFDTEAQAQKYGGKMRSAHNTGLRGGIITASLAHEAREAERILDGTGISLVEAARQAVARIAGKEDLETFGDRYDRAMLWGEMHWSGRYRADMELLPRYLTKGFMRLPCGTIGISEMEDALGENIARSTMDGRMRMIRAVLGFRERHRKGERIAIHTLEEAEAVLAACDGIDERRAVAVLYFAGIRPDSQMGEISRLQWEDFGRSSITIHPETSKTGTDRIIPITARLAREIKGHPKEGPVAPAGWKKRWQRIRKDAGMTGQDVTRHTFASHFLAWQGEKAAKDAIGHTEGSRTIFKHYRRAVTEKDGKAFFA